MPTLSCLSSDLSLNLPGSLPACPQLLSKGSSSYEQEGSFPAALQERLHAEGASGHALEPEEHGPLPARVYGSRGDVRAGLRIRAGLAPECQVRL